jgi:adenine-specific DNA-methyltransferase
VLVDRPEVVSGITRVGGPFVVEATIPTPLDPAEPDPAAGSADGGTDASYLDRMLDVLRRSPVIQLGGGRTLTLANVRPPARSLHISADAQVEGEERLVAVVFGPENGAVSERLVFDAGQEAALGGYSQLLVIGFAIQPEARQLVESDLMRVPASYVQATPDLAMGDLLKTMRSSQIFSVTGLPEIDVRELPPEDPGAPPRYEVELLGLDLFDPATMRAEHAAGDDVPAWLLDTDYNELSFHVSQAFFPRTGAWDALRRALKGEFEESVWEHLAGTTSAPFPAGEHRRIAVKVIDDRGNELLVVRSLDEARQ